MATAPNAEQIQHVLRNKTQCLCGVATEIERLARLSCRYCRHETFTRLTVIAGKLREYAKELDDLPPLL